MKYWFLVAVSLCSAGSFADARDALNARLAAMDYLAADFTQHIRGPRGELIEQSSGIVRLLRPRFRWEVIEPYPQVIVTEDDQLKIYDPDLDQVMVRPLAEALVDTPLAVLTQEAVKLGEDYEIEQLTPDSFRLHPLSTDALFDEILLEFGPDGLETMVIRDHFGQSTDIRFENFAARSMIQSSDFTLDVPPGTDVF